MGTRRILAVAALAAAGALAGCDDAVDLVDKAAHKGESDVPEEARAPLDESTLQQLRQRSQIQNFN